MKKVFAEVDELRVGHVMVQVDKRDSRPDYCAWLQFRRGSYNKGSGTVIAVPAAKDCQHTLAIGDVVEYQGGTEKRRPVISRKLRVKNQKEVLRQKLMQDLQAALTFNPGLRK